MFFKSKSKRSLAVVILLLTSNLTAAQADYDVSLIKNDKELVTHAYSRLKKRTATRRVGEYSTLTYRLLTDAIVDLEKTGKHCELNLIQSLKKNLDKLNTNVEVNSETVSDLIVVWRSENQIDDILFEILNQSATLSESMDAFKPTTPSKKELNAMQELLTEKGITDFDLSIVYGPMKDSTLNSPNCTLSYWQQTAQQLDAIAGDKDQIRLLNIAALDKKIITQQEFELLEFYRTAGVQNFKIDLRTYLDLLSDIKNKSRGKTPSEDDLLPNELSSKYKASPKGLGIRLKKPKKMTYRQGIYFRFNKTQVLMIEELMKKTFNRMDAQKTEVVFTTKFGPEVVPVSPMGQYFLARKLLRKDIDDLNRSTFFQGNPITYEDLVAVSLETGLINAKIIDSVLKIDNLWNPEVPKWKKIVNYTSRIAGTATIFLPPPYNIISSMGLVFVEGIIYRKSQKPSQADQAYDFF